MYYDHSRPFTREIRFYHAFSPAAFVEKPTAYVIPQGWHRVVDLLKLNKVNFSRLTRDTTILVKSYRILDYKSNPGP
jgi:hypothetical protein